MARNPIRRRSRTVPLRVECLEDRCLLNGATFAPVEQSDPPEPASQEAYALPVVTAPVSKPESDAQTTTAPVKESSSAPSVRAASSGTAAPEDTSNSPTTASSATVEDSASTTPAPVPTVAPATVPASSSDESAEQAPSAPISTASNQEDTPNTPAASSTPTSSNPPPANMASSTEDDAPTTATATTPTNSAPSTTPVPASTGTTPKDEALGAPELATPEPPSDGPSPESLTDSPVPAAASPASSSTSSGTLSESERLATDVDQPGASDSLTLSAAGPSAAALAVSLGTAPNAPASGLPILMALNRGVASPESLSAASAVETAAAHSDSAGNPITPSTGSLAGGSFATGSGAAAMPHEGGDTVPGDRPDAVEEAETPPEDMPLAGRDADHFAPQAANRMLDGLPGDVHMLDQALRSFLAQMEDLGGLWTVSEGQREVLAWAAAGAAALAILEVRRRWRRRHAASLCAAEGDWAGWIDLHEPLPEGPA